MNKTVNYDSKIRAKSFLEYLSPFGVISTKEFIYRLFAFIGLLIVSIFLGTSLVSAIDLAKTRSVMATQSSNLITIMVISVFMLFWFLLATLAKEYRTKGVPMPFFFALITHFIPLLFVFTFLISSKLKRETNMALAAKQRLFRDTERDVARQKKLPKKD